MYFLKNKAFAPPLGQKTHFYTGQNVHSGFLSHSEIKLIFFRNYWFLCLKRIIQLDQLFHLSCISMCTPKGTYIFAKEHRHMILRVTRAWAFCSVQTIFATSINRCLTNAHYEVFRPSKHRLHFILQINSRIAFNSVSKIIKSVRFTENCAKWLNSW